MSRIWKRNLTRKKRLSSASVRQECHDTLALISEQILERLSAKMKTPGCGALRNCLYTKMVRFKCDCGDLPEPRERVIRVKSRAVKPLPTRNPCTSPHEGPAIVFQLPSTIVQVFSSHALHRSSSPTTRQPLCSLYGWERGAGRGLPPCPCYCSVNTHSAPPPTFFTDATRRLSPPARANQALFVQLHGNSGTFTETLAL